VLTGDHRRAASVDRVNDLGAIDALEVDRRDPEVAVAELALDDDERHAFVGHFDSVGVPKLMWSEPSPDARCDRRTPQVGPGAGTRPLAATRPAVEDTEQRADGKLDS
jgi:hypothetical protein